MMIDRLFTNVPTRYTVARNTDKMIANVSTTDDVLHFHGATSGKTYYRGSLDTLYENSEYGIYNCMTETEYRTQVRDP